MARKFIRFYFPFVSFKEARAHAHCSQGKIPGRWLLVTAL